jgi:hypothetical protein
MIFERAVSNVWKTDDYMEKCPYCNQYYLPIQKKDHFCDAPLIDVKEIPVIFSYDVSEDNGDKVTVARGYDGILYRLIRCKNPLIDESLQRKRTDKDFTVPCESAYKGMLLYTRANINRVETGFKNEQTTTENFDSEYCRLSFLEPEN